MKFKKYNEVVFGKLKNIEGNNQNGTSELMQFE